MNFMCPLCGASIPPVQGPYSASGSVIEAMLVALIVAVFAHLQASHR